MRRVFSAGVRTAYAGAVDETGIRLSQKDLRGLVKGRFAGSTTVDAWVLHCATLEGMDLRKARPDGTMVFGGRGELRRREKGLISSDEWREKRLRPLCSRGDMTFAGNRHFRLDPDARTCILLMYGRKIELHLAGMRGNAGQILRQTAALAAAKRINVTFRIDATHLHVTVDPTDLLDHPERRRPVRVVQGRCVALDLNPDWIGLAGVQNRGDPRSLADTTVLCHELVRVGFGRDASKESVRETLAAVCDRAIGMARLIGAGTIAVEKGLGKLRSSGRNRGLNHLLNFWARTILVQMLRRKAGLAGIRVVAVWCGYSTTIGNLSFELPDACASAAEVGRRCIAADTGIKDVLPILDGAWLAGRRKDPQLRAEVRTWGDVHWETRTAKDASGRRIGCRRPHPAPPDPDVRESPRVFTPASHGHAFRRLRHAHRPGILFLPMPAAKAASSPEHRGRGCVDSTRESG